MDELIKQLYEAIASGNDEATGKLCSQIAEVVCSKPKDIRQHYYEDALHGLIIEHSLQADIYKHPEKAGMHTLIQPKADREQQRRLLVRFQLAISNIVSYLANVGVSVSKQYIDALKRQGVPDYDLLWRYNLTMEDLQPLSNQQSSCSGATSPRGRKKDTINNYLSCNNEHITLDELKTELQGKQASEYAKVIARLVALGKLTDKPSYAAVNSFVSVGCSRANYDAAFTRYYDYYKAK